MCAALSQAGGLKPKDKVVDYPVHAELQHGFTIGAEYLVHTVPSPTSNPRDGMVANDYLVIELGVFGPRTASIDLSIGTFQLLINGKMTLTTDSPGSVASSIKFDDRAQRARVQMAGNAGPVGVGTAPNRGPRFPGDPTGNHPISVDGPEISAPVDKDAPVSVDDRIKLASLPQGALAPPFAGLIFFPYAGKTKSIKTLELIYEGPEGKVTLKLE
jgi:hypothetical protein